MAEETNNTPLDSLGPQLGSMNPQAPSLMNMQPFEGESIAPNNINIPFNPLPLPVFPRQDFNIKDKVTGHLFANEPAKNKNITPDQFVDALKSKILTNAEASTTGNQYARLYSYDAGPSGQNFYKRYAAFGDETFEKIGFNPIRNNEAIYNANTTWSQRTGRMLAYSAWPLFKSGFTAGPRSLMRMLDGDFGTDPEDARLYAEASAIGQDTAGGVGAFMNNLTMNFAYTAGIMVEAIAEEAVGALLAPATGGASFAAATINNARKLPGVFRAAGAGLKGTTTANAFSKTLQSANNINNARKIWSAAKLEKGFASSLGRFINPLENTAEGIFTSLKNADNLQGLARAYNTGYKTAGGFYRDVRSLNMALSEARLEGGFTQNEIYNDLYREYYDIHGDAPSDEMQKEMRKEALEGGLQTRLWNAGLIYLSNKIVFPNIVGPRGGLKSFLSSKTDDILDLKFGKVKKTMVTPEGSKIAKPKYEWVENSFKNTLKETYKQPIRKLLPAVGGYFKANVTEGLQENFQEIIADASKNYHMDLFRDKNRSYYEFSKGMSGVAFSEYLKDSAKEHFTTSGLETFASGFFMGFLGGGLNKSFQYLSTGVNYLKDKDAYINYKTAKKEYGKRIAANLSSINVKDFFNSRTFNFSEQMKEVSKTAVTEKLVRDLEHQKFVSQLNMVLDHGMMEMFVDHLGSYKNYTAEEFQEALGFETLEEATAAQQKIDEVLENSRKVQKRYDSYKERYPDPIKANEFAEIEKLGKDSIEYQNASFLNEAWRISRNNAVFYGESFDNTLKRMSSIVSNVVTNGPLSEANAQYLNILFEPKKMYAEADMLKTEIEAAKQAGLDNKEDILIKKKRLKALESFSEKLDEFYKYNRSDESLKERIVSLFLMSGTEFTDEDVNKQFAKIKEEITEEKILASSLNLEKAYKEYLKTISGLSNDFIFDEAVDKSFVDLLDYYKLSDESKELAKAINILNDPQGFVEHVDRNMTWMKQLYNNRKEYYTEMVNHALNSNLANDILNSLASEAIYLSIDDFEKFIKYGMLPDEFYDDAKKIVIKRNNPLYNRYASVLNHYYNESKDPVGKSTGSEKLDEKIVELEKKMQSELDKLDKVEERKDLDPVEIPDGKTITFKKLFGEVSPGTYVDVTFVINGIDTKSTIYRTEEGFKYDNESGDNVVLGSRTRIKEAQPFVIQMVPDPEKAKEIIDLYNQLKAEAVVQNTEEELTQSDSSDQKITFTIDDIQAKSPELLQQIQDLFQNSMSEEELANLDDFAYREELERFIKINPEVIKLVNDYNNNLEIKKSLKTDDEINLVINYKGQEIDINEIPIDDLSKDLINKELYLKNLEESESKDVNLIQTLKREIAIVKKFLKTKEKTNLTERQREVISILEKLAEVEHPIVNGKYFINNILHDRVSNIVEQLSGKKYEYGSKRALSLLMSSAFKGKKFNETTLKDFIEKVEKNINEESSSEKRLFGFDFLDKKEVTKDVYGNKIETSLDKVKTQLQEYLKANKNKSYDEVKDGIEKIFAEVTYEESRIIGNYIDATIRDYFAGIQPKFDPNRISREAYENLFGSIDTLNQDGTPVKKGILGQIKDIIDANDMYIYSKGITLYDSDAAIAGTIDLILVSKTGKVFIVDVKTGNEGKWSHFTPEKLTGLNKDSSELIEKDNYSKVENYTIQQNIYANLLYNMTGIDADIALLPIQQIENKSNAKIESIQSPKYLPEGKATITLKKDYKLTTDSKSVREKVDERVPKKEIEKVIQTLEVPTAIDEAKNKNIELAALGGKTPTDKKADIERKSGESSADFINRLFENNYFVEADGKQLFSLTQGRWGVVVNINGINIPFYQSTSGTDTKVAGQWYPFFGDQGNWVIKGNSDDSNVGYGFKAIQDVQSFLNKNIKEKDAIATSGLISSEVIQNQNSLRGLDESNIKGNEKISLNKEATAQRLSKLMGYSLEQAKKTKSDTELFKLASKKVFAELAALEGSTETIEAKKADIEKQKEVYKKMTKGTPINKDAPKGIKVGDKYDDRLKIIVIDESLADNFDSKIADNNGEGYEVISKIKEYGEMENGVQTKAPKVETIIFNNKADADAFFEARKIKLDKNIADAELDALEGASTQAPTPTVSDKKAEGTNARGTTYKGETTEKDGLKVTEYSEFRSDGKRISKGGRIMAPSEFIEEYNITDQDYLDNLEGATEIRIYEVRVGKDGKASISIQATFPEGNVEMEVAGVELAALEGGVSDKKADIINKLFEKNILTPLNNGNSWMLDEDGRIFVVANINGNKVLFYTSSEGTSGKTEGTWYPVIGISNTGYIIKGTKDSTNIKYNFNEGYGIKEIKDFQDFLNKNITNVKGKDLKTLKSIFGDKVETKVNFKINKEFGLAPFTNGTYKVQHIKLPGYLSREEAIDIWLERFKSKEVKQNIDVELAALGGKTPTDKKADIERRQRVADIITSQLELGVELPKILETLAEQGYVEKINNSAFFKQSAGRDAVVFNIDGAIVPVYRSSKGTSSKTKGEWYPFFFNGGDWLVKAGADTYKDGYNNPIIKQILDSLNKNYKYDKPLAQVEGNNEELLALLPLGGLDLDVSFEDNSGIYDFQNYIAIAVILKDWQSKLGNIDVSGYQDYLDGASSSLIKTNPTLKSEIEKAFKIPSDIFAELAALEGASTQAPTPTVSDKKAADFANEVLQKTSQASLEWITQKENELSELADDLSTDMVIQLGEIINQRKLELEADQNLTSNPSISIEKGTQLIANDTIFRKNNKDILAIPGTIAVVTNVNTDKGTVTVKAKYNNSVSQRTISLEELDKMFKLYEEVMGKETTAETVKRSSEEISNINETNSAVSNFVNNETLQKKAEATADNSSIEETENKLLEDLDC